MELDYVVGLLDERLALDVAVFYERYKKPLGWVSWDQVRPEDFEDHVAHNPGVRGRLVGQLLEQHRGRRRPRRRIGVIGDLGGGPRGTSGTASKPFGAESDLNILTNWDGETWANYPIHLVKAT